MIEITPNIVIQDHEIGEDFVRASGPGGQNVNKVSSAVVLRFNIANSSLPAPVRERLMRIAGKRVTADGTLIIKAQQFRTQERNRDDAVARLIELVRQAVEAPKLRLATKPTRGSRIRTLDAKRHRGNIKKSRQSPPRSDE
jgi:ribosome-associated protein